jgi:tRNA(Met) cytidine acetyltransferase|tara:strand:- start:143 stop:2197 length:2055 start_codon:yes stop_codon:yes gene_type:complete
LRSITQLADFRKPLSLSQHAGHRLMLVVAMVENHGLAQAKKLPEIGEPCLWVDVPQKRQSQAPKHQYISANQANQYLGTSNQYVIYNAHRGFNASALCALSGTIKGTGVLILLTPPTSQWQSNFDSQLKAYGQLERHAHSNFIQWWQRQWQHHSAVYVLHEEVNQVKTTHWQPFTKLLKQWPLLEPTREQQSIITTLVTAYNQQSEIVYTIEGHRGRGKSACLGWLIKTIGKEDNHGPVVVTAPSKRALGSMTQTAGLQKVNFHALDALLKQRPKAGLVIVDEAAAIPLSQLTKLVKHYKLVVLSSTQDGYEGSGQGYRLKLPHIISTLGLTSKAMTLTQPMRWQADDPLETFIRSSFLCDVRIPDAMLDLATEDLQHVSYRLMTGEKLAQDNELLKQVYALLMLAHYQTTPQDLRLLLDHPQHKIYLCYVNDCLVGMAWVAQEGNLDSTLAQQISLGRRRIQGHLLAQILAQQAGFSIACEMRSWRIQRLVVLPRLQGKGLGSALLNHIYACGEAHQIDFIGASFSASNNTLRFWLANNFTSAWLGLRPDTATGLNSVQVIQPISQGAKALKDQLKCHFKGYLDFGKGMWFTSVDAETWQGIYPKFIHATAAMLNVEQQRRLLILLAKGHAGFSGPLHLLYQQLLNDKDKQLVMHAAQNNTHKGLQKDVRRLALSLLPPESEQ